MNRPWNKKRHSLSGRLVLLFIAMTSLIVLTVGITIALGFRDHFQDNIRPHLMQYLDYIEQDIGSPPDQAKAVALSEQLNVDIHYFSKTQQWGSNASDINLDDIHYERQFLRQGVEYGFGYHKDHEFLISRHKDYTLVFSVPRHERGDWHGIFPLLVIIALLVFLYHSTRKLFAPIEEIRNGVARIGAGELGYRLNIQRRNELGELGESINVMANDIEQMMEAKRQLLLAISHELRSPLTRAKVSAAMLEDKRQQDEIQRELDEMEALIEEILETERLSTRHHILNKSETQLQLLITELIERYFSGQSIEIDMPEQTISIAVDSARIKLLLKNILNNALQHNPKDTRPPCLSVRKTDQSINISIQDFGHGIKPEHLSHLMEPFYRTDAARQRETGGYGLGLYLCKVIAEAHGGQLQINSKIGEGTTLVVSLPVK